MIKEDLNKQTDLFGFDPKEKQNPFWLEDHVIGNPIHAEGGSKFFKDQKISFQREKNIITFEWELPEDFESIEFYDDGELYQRIQHSLM